MGKYDNIYPRPGRIHRAWGIGVVDALNELYGWLTDGTHDINVNRIYAIYGNFASRPYAEGRPVILDGDPITIYKFYDLAKQQITEAIDNSTQLSYLPKLETIEQYARDTRDVLYAIYGNLAYIPYTGGIPVTLEGVPISIYQFYDVAKEQITEAIDKSKATETLDQIYGNILTIEHYTKDTRDVVVKLRIDEYGNIGVRIAEPVDEYGYVKTVVVDDKANLAKETTLQSIQSILDMYLSTRASEATLSNIKSKTDNIDVALSTRASEATLSSILSKIDITLSNLRDAITASEPYNKTLADLYERLNSIRGQLDATLSTRASETTVSGILSKLDITLSALRDALRGVGGKTLTDLDTELENIYSKLDVSLSTRASETTLSGIKTQTDKLSFDASGRLAIQNPPNLDVALSTRASESTLLAVKSKTDNLDVALSTRASESTLSGIKSQTDKLTFDESNNLKIVVQNFPTDYFKAGQSIGESPFNITKVAGTALTGRDWSGDFAKLQNLDTALSTRASESTLSGIKTQIDKLTFDTSNRLAIQNPPNMDVALSTRASESTLSAIKSQTDKLTFDASNYLQVNVKSTVNPSNLDVALSTRASETTLSGIKSQTDKLSFDASNRLAIQNPPNLDVALSTRASESTLSGLSGKFPSAVTLADNLSNPTTTIIGAANLGFDGTYWRRIATDTSGRMKVALDSIPNPSNLDVALSTRASEATLSAIKNALASVGTDKMRVSIVDSLPAGTNKIGSVDVSSIPNPSNLDVALSTRASESTLSGLSGKFPSAVSLSDSLSNPTTTIIGDALLGFDGTYWRRVRVDTSGRLAIQNPPNFDVALSTRASETTLSGIKSQTDKLTFDASNYLQVNVKATVNPSNLDVALSTRASEATLSAIKNALASVGTDKMRVSVVDALPESSFNISKVGGTALTGRDWSADFAKLQNLDVSLTTQSFLERWGRNVSPFWIYGSEVTAPAAGTALVSRTVTSGKTGYIYGFVITAGEANDFRLNWTSGGTTRSVRFTLASKGSVVLISPVALNEGLPADGGSSITITNVNAGSSGIVYQATILYAEV